VLRAFLRRPMNGYNFTERVRKALAMAREEAARLKHEYVGTEHILLGLLRDDDGVAITVIQNLGVKPDDLVVKVDGIVKRGRPGPLTGPDLPYTSRAKKVLELAMSEARDAGHDYVGTEHILLGLVREERGIAAQLLVDSGITLERARDEVIRILGTGPLGRRPGSPIGVHGGAIAEMEVWNERDSAAGESIVSSRAMAASIIELLARDSGVDAVFADQGIDVAALVAALRAFPPPAPPSDSPPAA
jgi:ATP-dependent Clp protease ATP-binding subunit ClpA